MTAPVRCACIDVGSNTTRLLVAECLGGGRLREVHQDRAFTQIGRDITADREIPPDTITRVAAVVARQARLAEQAGAAAIHAVATAAIRAAVNRDVLADAVHAASGLPLRVLGEADEARLAFVGAAREAGRANGELAVVDVGGGSSEIAIGTPPGDVRWSVSLPLGSGTLTRQFLAGDPPTDGELAAARRHVESLLEPLDIPRPPRALAVGGSANSMAAFAAGGLGPDAFRAAMARLSSGSAAEVASATGLAAQRVELLPGGLVILEALATRLGTPLELGRGGIREGVVLEAAADAGRH